jgi:hypothetical protein
MERYSMAAGSACTTKKYLLYQWILLAVSLILVIVG